MKKLTVVTIAVFFAACSLTIAQASVPKNESFKWKLAEKNYINALASENEGVRQSAAGYLAEYHLSGGIEPLIYVLNKDRTEKVRMAAALALVRFGTVEARSAIEDASIHDGSEKVAEFCRSLLSASFSPSVVAK
jgi:hypothetical protein